MTKRRLDPERGAAFVLTMILTSALIAGGALALYLQLADVRASKTVTDKRAAMYCAEGGLAGARSYIVNNSGAWSAMLDGDPLNDPDGYPVEGDLDGDGIADWHVEIKDNDDEHPIDNPLDDSDGTIFMIATCPKYPDSSREIMQLVRMQSGSFVYRNQRGQGAGNTNNAN
jgi:hypothetical protein